MDEIPPSLHLGDFSGAISLSRQWNESKKVKTNSVSLSRGTMLDCLMPSLYTESAPEISARFPTPDLPLINILCLGPAGAINPPSVRICDCSGSRGTELIWAESERARTHGTAALG